MQPTPLLAHGAYAAFHFKQLSATLFFFPLWEKQSSLFWSRQNGMGSSGVYIDSCIPDNCIPNLQTDSIVICTFRDPNTGHEFAVGSFGDCSGDGWILVSTRDDCTYQRTGVPPQFYFSTTQTVANTNPGKVSSSGLFPWWLSIPAKYKVCRKGRPDLIRFTCCHAERESVHQTCYLIWSLCSDIRLAP